MLASKQNVNTRVWEKVNGDTYSACTATLLILGYDSWGGDKGLKATIIKTYTASVAICCVTYKLRGVMEIAVT